MKKKKTINMKKIKISPLTLNPVILLFFFDNNLMKINFLFFFCKLHKINY